MGGTLSAQPGRAEDVVDRTGGSQLAGEDGGERPTGYYWHGRIDEVAFFNRALSAADIERLFRGADDLGKQGSPGFSGEPAKNKHEERRVSTDKK